MRTAPGLIAILLVIAGCKETPAPPTPPASRPEPAAVAPPRVPDLVLDEELRDVVRLVARGRYEDARSAAAAFLDEHPDDPRAIFLTGLALHKERRYAEARPHLERALALAPDYHEVKHFLGWCCYHVGDLNAARRAFAAHIAADPDESDSHFGLALVDLEDGRLDTAEAGLRHAIAMIEALEDTDPTRHRLRAADLAKCHARLADVHLARDEFAAARDELLAAIAIDQTQESLYYALSVAYRRLGDDEKADRALEERERVRRTGRGADG